MSNFTKHVGKTTNTDRRIVVVYMQIPGREDHALVVDTDALPARYHDDLMTIVQGEGQHSTVLADILSRRIMPYTGADMLSTLHAANALQAIPISNVIMLPQPNHGIPLTDVLKHMGKSTIPTDVAPVEQVKETEYRDNRIVENQAIDKQNEKYQIAANILMEAKMLEDDAARKREAAYQIYPALRPVTPAAPVEAKAPVNTAIQETTAPVEAVKARRSPAKKTSA